MPEFSEWLRMASKDSAVDLVGFPAMDLGGASTDMERAEERPSVQLIGTGLGHQGVVVSQLVALLMTIPGVYSVDLASPAATVVIAPNQVPALGAVTLTMEAPSNE
jgi:hypothetical protein